MIAVVFSPNQCFQLVKFRLSAVVDFAEFILTQIALSVGSFRMKDVKSVARRQGRRQGDDFHQLVEHVERAIAGLGNVTIASPKRLRDKVTGELREHDVVLTYKHPNRELVTAIECRDRSRPIGSGQVEEFHNKCLDTGVDKGVMVTSLGFTDPARVKARHYGIQCLSLIKVPQIDWCDMTDVVIRERRLKHGHVSLGIHPSLVGRPMRLFFGGIGDETQEIDLQNPYDFINSVWQTVPPDAENDCERTEHSAHIAIENLDDFNLVDEVGNSHPIKHLYVDLEFIMVESKSPLTFYHYLNKDNSSLYEALVTDRETFEKTSGRLMLIRGDQSSFRVRFIADHPHPDQEPKETKAAALADTSADELPEFAGASDELD
jgi:hypothetical protein